MSMLIVEFSDNEYDPSNDESSISGSMLHNAQMESQTDFVGDLQTQFTMQSSSQSNATLSQRDADPNGFEPHPEFDLWNHIRNEHVNLFRSDVSTTVNMTGSTSPSSESAESLCASATQPLASSSQSTNAVALQNPEFSDDDYIINPNYLQSNHDQYIPYPAGRWSRHENELSSAQSSIVYGGESSSAQEMDSDAPESIVSVVANVIASYCGPDARVTIENIEFILQSANLRAFSAN